MCAGGGFQPQLSLTPGCHFCAVCHMGCKAVNWFFSVPGHAVSLPCPQMLTKLANIAEPGLLWVSQGMVFHLLGGTAGSGALLHVPTSNILSLGLGP